MRFFLPLHPLRGDCAGSTPLIEVFSNQLVKRCLVRTTVGKSLLPVTVGFSIPALRRMPVLSSSSTYETILSASDFCLSRDWIVLKCRYDCRSRVEGRMSRWSWYKFPSVRYHGRTSRCSTQNRGSMLRLPPSRAMISGQGDSTM